MFGTYFTGMVRALIELGPSCVHAAGCPRYRFDSAACVRVSKRHYGTFHSFFVLPPQSGLGYHDLLNSNPATTLNCGLNRLAWQPR